MHLTSILLVALVPLCTMAVKEYCWNMAKNPFSDAKRCCHRAPNWLVPRCTDPQADVEYTEELYKKSMPVEEFEEVKDVLKELRGGEDPVPIEVDADFAKSDDMEYSKNAHLMHLLYQTDIMLDVSMARELKDAHRKKYETKAERRARLRNVGRNRRNKRKIADFANTDRQMWPDAKIVYYIKDGHKDREWRDAVKQSVDNWEENTCLSFTERTGDKDLLVFENSGGCASYIGYKEGGRTIATGSCGNSVISITHEIGHVLGLAHEQTRTDRDDHVRILWDNIRTDGKFNYEINDYTQTSIPYDYGSTMHYSIKGFSRSDSLDTMIPKDDRYKVTMGSRTQLSFYDIKAVNGEYCKSECKGVTLPCQHGGYPHPKDCRKCMCPRGLGGRYCDEVQDSIDCPVSSGDIEATASWQTKTVDKIEGQCFWKINSPTGTRIELEFDELNVECDLSKGRCKQFVELKFEDLGNTGPHFCCENHKPRRMKSDSNVFLMMHYRPEDFRDDVDDPKYTVKYRYVGRPTGVTTTTQRTTTTTRQTTTTARTTTTQRTTTTDAPSGGSGCQVIMSAKTVIKTPSIDRLKRVPVGAQVEMYCPSSWSLETESVPWKCGSPSPCTENKIVMKCERNGQTLRAPHCRRLGSLKTECRRNGGYYKDRACLIPVHDRRSAMDAQTHCMNTVGPLFSRQFRSRLAIPTDESRMQHLKQASRLLRVDFTRGFVGITQNPRSRSRKSGWSWATGVRGSSLTMYDRMTSAQVGFEGSYPKSRGEHCAYYSGTSDKIKEEECDYDNGRSSWCEVVEPECGEHWKCEN